MTQKIRDPPARPLIHGLVLPHLARLFRLWCRIHEAFVQELQPGAHVLPQESEAQGATHAVFVAWVLPCSSAQRVDVRVTMASWVDGEVYLETPGEGELPGGYPFWLNPT